MSSVADTEPASEPVFAARELSFRYRGESDPALRAIDMGVPEGRLYGVIGPNGSGKSTLVKLLLGALRPTGGRCTYRGKSPAVWGERGLARRVGVVPQAESIPFPIAVRELVAMGRYPHLGLWRLEGNVDHEAVERALERCSVRGLAHRSFQTLSGGEGQRVRIARALAQEPETLVLDEPTAALDVRHEMTIFELLRELANEEGITVLLVTHNLNLASRYTDRLLLLEGGSAVAEGSPPEVLARERIERTYEWPVAVRPHAGPGPDTGARQVVPLAGQGRRR